MPRSLIGLGLAHEEQHQELMLMDVLHLLANRRSSPPMVRTMPADAGGATGQFQLRPGAWSKSVTTATDLRSIMKARDITSGCNPSKSATGWSPMANGWASSRTAVITPPALWLSEGWTKVQENGWNAPLYWQHDESWQEMSLRGLQAHRPDAPVTPHQLLRSRRLSHVGRRPPADRGRMGSRRPRRCTGTGG